MKAGGALLAGTLGRLRHPWLFAIAGSMLVADLLIPDVLPFVDEVLLAAVTAGFALLRKRRAEGGGARTAAADEESEQE